MSITKERVTAPRFSGLLREHAWSQSSIFILQSSIRSLTHSMHLTTLVLKSPPQALLGVSHLLLLPEPG